MAGDPSNPVAAGLKSAYEAVLHGDLGPLRKYLWPDCVLHVPGRTSISGEIRGWDAAERWSTQFFQRGGTTYGEDIISVVADDHWAFLMATYHAERNGRKLEDRSVNVFRLRDGRVAEMWVLVGDCKIFDEIFA